MLPLRSYQRQGIQFIEEHKRVILADEQGLGKTLTSLQAAMSLTQEPRRILVVAPRVALGTWRNEGRKWFGIDSFIYSGSSNKIARSALWKDYIGSTNSLLIITYAMLEEIGKRRRNWDVIIYDEYHRAGLINHKSATFKHANYLYCTNIILLSGTPVKKGPHNLYGPLHLIDPQKFRSYWSFVNAHCLVTKDYFGYTIEGRPKSPREFKKMLDQYLIRRRKEDVLEDLPPLQRQALYIDLTNNQRVWYNRVVEEGIIEGGRGLILCPNDASKIIRLRQILICPKIVGLDDYGGALSVLPELVQESYDQNRPVTVCVPFREAIPYIVEVLRPLGAIYTIHGQMKSDPVSVAELFQKDPRKNKALIFTIKSGMSFNAFSASNAFFVGAEWSAIENWQAEDRIHRIGQVSDRVNIYYLLYPDTIDDPILQRLDENTFAQNWVLDPLKLLDRLKKS